MSNASSSATKPLALDISGNAGQPPRLPSRLRPHPGQRRLKYWLSGAGRRRRPGHRRQRILGSQEFKTLYGSAPSHADYVSRL